MIILNMIVKDEAHCLERCLRSVKPFIHAAVIVDTGSTDGTPELISDPWLCGIQHCVQPCPWVNFAWNRTESYRLAQSSVEPGHGNNYVLLMDADEELIAEPGFTLGDVTAPVVGMWHRTPNGGLYVRPQLLNTRYDFRWEGVVHEELICEQIGEGEGQILKGAFIQDHFDSARNHDPDKAYKDALLLLQQPKTPRNVFYLAQSWRDAGYPENALYHYRLRSTMGGFEEEVWYSLFMVGALQEQLFFTPEEVKAAYNAAYNYRRGRAEPMRALTDYLAAIGDTEQAAICQEIANQIPITSDTLYVDPSAYVSRTSRGRP